MAQVKVDHMLRWRGLLEPLVLVEDKSISVMESHLLNLLNIPQDLFRRTEQWNWEGAFSIIAKVNLYSLFDFTLLG